MGGLALLILLLLARLRLCKSRQPGDSDKYPSTISATAGGSHSPKNSNSPKSADFTNLGAVGSCKLDLESATPAIIEDEAATANSDPSDDTVNDPVRASK